MAPKYPQNPSSVAATRAINSGLSGNHPQPNSVYLNNLTIHDLVIVELFVLS